MKKELKAFFYISFSLVILTLLFALAPTVAHAYTSEYPTVTISGADNDEWNGMYTPIPYTACTYQNSYGARIRLAGFTWCLNPNGGGLAYFSNVYTSSTIPPKTGWVKYVYTDDYGYHIGTSDADFTLTYPIASLAQTETTVSEAAGSVSVNVQLSEATSFGTTINYKTDNGTAQAGVDFTGVSQAENKSVYIPPWQTSATIDIPILNDDTFETAENFTVSIYGISGGARIQMGSTTVTVEDDDPFPTVGFASDSFLADEEGGSADIRFYLSNPSCNDVTVKYQTAGFGASGADYTPEAGTITIPSGTTAASFAVHGISNLPKTISVSLSSPMGAALGAYSSATVTILKTKAYFAQTAVSANEADSGATLQVCLSDPAQDDITIDYYTADGSASATEDYIAVTGTLTIPAGETSGLVEIALVNDIVYEENETFTFNLLNPVGTVLEDEATAMVTILSDDLKPSVQFSYATATVNEKDGSVTLPVALSNPSAYDLTVNHATTNGTAKAGQDYMSQSGTLTIPNGATEGFISIPIINNSKYESNRSFTVTLSNASGATLGTPVSTSVTIVNDDPIPSVQFADSTIIVNETAGEVIIPVQFSNPTAYIMQVQVRTTNGTAAAGQDYTAHTAGYAVSNDSTSFNLRIPILNDDLYEIDETFNITLYGPSGCILGGKSVCTVTIVSEELPYEIQFQPNSLTVNEDEGSAGLTVQLSRVSATNTTVHYQTVDNTAQAGEDYIVRTGTLIIPAGNTTGTINIPVLNDNFYEANEDFTVILSEPGGAIGTILGVDTTAAVTIVSEEAKPGIQLSANSVTVSENVGTVELTIQLSHPSGFDVSVGFNTSDSTAVGGDDYTHKVSTVTIPKGATSGSVSVSILNDTVFEGNEFFFVTIQTPIGAALGTITNETVHILNDDPLPTVEFSSNFASIGEDDSAIALNVQLSNPSAFDITVNYATTKNSASAGEDYLASAGTVTIPKGTVSKTVSVPIVSDTIYEGDENFSVALSSPSGADLGTIDKINVTILDADPVPSIEFISDTARVGEDKGSVVLKVVLSHPSAFDSTINYASSDISATAGEDYLVSSGVLIIPKGTVSASITISILDDNVYETDESFAVTLSAPTGVVLDTDQISTVTIESEELVPVIEFSANSVSIDEESNSVTVYAVLTHPSAFDITVDFHTTDESAISGEDYTSQTGVLTIPKGSTSGFISVPILHDDTYELDETFIVTLSTPSSAALGDKKIVTVTIVSTDLKPTVEFAANEVITREDDGSVTLFVRLSNLSAFDVKVNYETRNASALSTEDYIAASGTLSIPKGTIEGSFTVPILEDSIYEGDETFTVTLSSPMEAALGVTDRTTVTILDADTIPSLEFSAATVLVSEDAESIKLTLQLSQPSAFDITVDYTTMDSSAVAGEDYSFEADTLTIAKGETLGSIVVPISEDTIYEGDETFVLVLYYPSGAVLGLQDNSTITIVNNDPKPTLEFYEDTYSANEDNGSVRLRVQLSHPSAFDITVNYKTEDVSAVAGKDYIAKTGTMTIPKRALSGLLEIPVVPDTVYEDDKTFDVTLDELSGAELGSKNAATVTIVSEEKQPIIGFSAPAVSVDEAAGSDEIPVNLSHLSEFDIEVNYEAVDASAKAGEDYTVSSGTLIIPTGFLSGSIPVSVLPDSRYEGNETFTVVLSKPLGAVLGTNYVNDVTIEEDDIPTITGVEEKYEIPDGGRIVLDPQPSGGIWDWDKTFFSATFNSPATFTALKTGTSTIAYTVGGTTQSITVTILEQSVTGRDFTSVYILLGLAACALVGAMFYLRRIRKADVSDKQ